MGKNVGKRYVRWLVIAVSVTLSGNRLYLRKGLVHSEKCNMICTYQSQLIILHHTCWIHQDPLPVLPLLLALLSPKSATWLYENILHDRRLGENIGKTYILVFPAHCVRRICGEDRQSSVKRFFIMYIWFTSLSWQNMNVTPQQWCAQLSNRVDMITYAGKRKVVVITYIKIQERWDVSHQDVTQT